MTQRSTVKDLEIKKPADYFKISMDFFEYSKLIAFKDDQKANEALQDQTKQAARVR